jgi:hypothetical protein
MSWGKNEGVEMGLGTCMMARPESLLILFQEDFGEIWIPLSVFHDDSDIWREEDVGREGKIVVKEWFAEKRGWV